MESKHLTHTLGFGGVRGNDQGVAFTLRVLSCVNQIMDLPKGGRQGGFSSGSATQWDKDND
jgi:hypothetical protein